MKATPFIALSISILIWIAGCAGPKVPWYPSVREEYRLVFWPSFDPPVEYVAQKDGFGRAALITYRYSGAGGYGSAFRGRPEVRMISEKQWAEFEKAFAKADFWNLPVKQPYRNGFDGAELIVEARQGDRIHRVQRWLSLERTESSFNATTSAISILADKVNSNRGAVAHP